MSSSNKINYFKISAIGNNKIKSKDFIEDCARAGIYEAHVGENGPFFSKNITNSSNKLRNINMVNPGDVCFSRVKIAEKHGVDDPIWKFTVHSRSEPEVLPCLPEYSIKVRHHTFKTQDCYTSIVFLKGDWEYMGTFQDLTEDSQKLLDKKYFPRTVIRLAGEIKKKEEQPKNVTVEENINEIQEQTEEIKICLELSINLKDLLSNVKLVDLTFK